MSANANYVLKINLTQSSILKKTSFKKTVFCRSSTFGSSDIRSVIQAILKSTFFEISVIKITNLMQSKHCIFLS